MKTPDDALAGRDVRGRDAHVVAARVDEEPVHGLHPLS